MTLKSKLSILQFIEIYAEYCRENNIHIVDGRGSYIFYEGMVAWLNEQGCVYRVAQEDAFVWENQGRQVEFFLRYVR